MHIWSLSLPFWPLSLPFCSPPAVWQAGREHPKIATLYKSDTYKISVFSTCIRNDRWRTPPAKKAPKPRGQRRALESKETPGAVRAKGGPWSQKRPPEPYGPKEGPGVKRDPRGRTDQGTETPGPKGSTPPALCR